MSDRLPYEDQLAQQLNDLPLPDENMAWADMKRRLEEEDDDRILPFWLNGCGLWGLVALVLIGIGWWFVRPDKWWSKTSNTETSTSNATKENTGNKNSTGNFETNPNQNGSTQTIDSNTQQNISTLKTDTANISNNPNQQPSQIPVVKDNSELSITVEPANRQKGRNTKSTTQKTSGTTTQKNKPANSQKKKQGGGEKVIASTQLTTTNQPPLTNKQQDPLNPGQQSNNPSTTKNQSTTSRRDSLVSTDSRIAQNDSARKKSSDSIAKKTDTVQTNPAKVDSAKKKSISFAAGLGMQQLIPIDGQKLTPYNSAGRKSSLADYIPSVYFRMYKSDKWFLQTEFRYGAPQYNPEFLYSETTDTAGTFSNITSTKLKKTFYHQLPITFNYFVMKDWSIGGGFVWNKFTSAISEQDITQRNNITQADSIISKGEVIKTDGADSNFVKSYFQAVFETQYRWKRFSFGARYAFGLQPYIKFVLPGGAEQQERNKSLQIFLRYELWRSKNKK
jgi:hypothetical protein